MFTQNQMLYFECQTHQHTARRTEWEEIEHFDGPVMPNEGNAFGRMLDRLARGLESLKSPRSNFRSQRGTSLLGQESLKTAS